MPPSLLVTGVRGGHDLDLWSLRADGAVLLGRLLGIEDDLAAFDDDADTVVAAADRTYATSSCRSVRRAERPRPPVGAGRTYPYKATPHGPTGRPGGGHQERRLVHRLPTRLRVDRRTVARHSGGANPRPRSRPRQAFTPSACTGCTPSSPVSSLASTTTQLTSPTTSRHRDTDHDATLTSKLHVATNDAAILNRSSASANRAARPGEPIADSCRYPDRRQLAIRSNTSPRGSRNSKPPLGSRRNVQPSATCTSAIGQQDAAGRPHRRYDLDLVILACVRHGPSAPVAVRTVLLGAAPSGRRSSAPDSVSPSRSTPAQQPDHRQTTHGLIVDGLDMRAVSAIISSHPSGGCPL